MALTGSFEDIGFAELLQLLNVGHKSGRLYIWTEREQAELFVMNGEVARARSRNESGPEVVYRVLGWRSGEFRFERTDDPVVREIVESTEALILEGMKRFDEWERVETEVPDTDTVLRQRVSAVDEQYDLLSPAAQSLLRLVDARRTVASLVRESGLEPAEALAAIAELLTAEIVEEWSEPHQPDDVLKADGRLPPAQGDLNLLATASLAGHGGSQATAAWEPRHKETTMGTSDTPGQGGERR
jgi:hypothetical protein